MKHAKSKHNIHMKIIDDKLRIIDDVPSSAVELSVKEKVIKIIILGLWWIKARGGVRKSFV